MQEIVKDGESGEIRDEAAARRLRAAVDGFEGAALRATAEFLSDHHVRRGRRGLAICAAASGAGTTFVTAAVGLALARSGLQVLIVEANLWRPGLAGLIPPLDPLAPGLRQYLAGEAPDLVSIINVNLAPNLSAVYAGPEGPEVRDRFDTDPFDRLLRDAFRTYDLTLIDTPAANRCAETRRIAAVAGYAAVVARRDVTMADDLGTLIKDLRLDRTEVIGSIFNEG